MEKVITAPENAPLPHPDPLGVPTSDSVSCMNVETSYFERRTKCSERITSYVETIGGVHRTSFFDS